MRLGSRNVVYKFVHHVPHLLDQSEQVYHRCYIFFASFCGSIFLFMIVENEGFICIYFFLVSLYPDSAHAFFFVGNWRWVLSFYDLSYGNVCLMVESWFFRPQVDLMADQHRERLLWQPCQMPLTPLLERSPVLQMWVLIYDSSFLSSILLCMWYWINCPKEGGEIKGTCFFSERLEDSYFLFRVTTNN